MKMIYKIPTLISMAVMTLMLSFEVKGQEIDNVPQDLKWSERMALSVMKRNPDSWMIDFNDEPEWGYTHGLVLTAMERLWLNTEKDKYYDYVKDYGQEMISEDGDIKKYTVTEFNIDNINPGRIFFRLHEETGKEQYLKVLNKLRKQLEWHPRTRNGGFWHKLVYPWQMWLDGLYMGQPFYTQYAKKFNEPEIFDDVARQFEIIENKAKDEETGLLYHGWDNSGLQKWSDPETGLSKNFWGRGIGWYAMAIVDVLDYFPEDHDKRDELEGYLQDLVKALAKFQDDESGLWYQVVDQGDREGNYLEASASSMYVYAMAKGVNEGYLDKKYKKVAKKGYQGIIDHLIKIDEDDGEVHITQCCAVAGLGGDPFRSGKYEYYINEKVRSNDPKATGPFIMAGLELDR